MRDHIKVTVCYFGCLAATLLVAGFLTAWSGLLTFLIVIFGIYAFPIALICGVILLSVGAMRAPFDVGIGKRIAAVLLAPCLGALLFFGVFHILWGGRYVGTFVRLMANKNQYEVIIAAERRGIVNRAARSEYGGIVYEVDAGPPLRIAFNPDGLLNNWSAIVYDPTGDVMQADGFDKRGRFRGPDRVTELFGGDLVACRQLWWSYYDCSFT